MSKSKRRKLLSILIFFSVLICYLVFTAAQYRIETDTALTIQRLGGRVSWEATWFTWLTDIEARMWWKVSVVDFNYVSLTDKQFEEVGPKIARLRGLRHLYLVGTKLTDKSLPLLKKLPELEFASIGGTPISNTSASELDALNFDRAE